MNTKRNVFSIILLLLLTAFCGVAYAADYQNVAVNVSLSGDGSADITETWQMSATDGTEMYLTKGNLDQQVISNFTVKEGSTVYQNVGSWATSETLAQKAYKCGIVTIQNGYELCWGLSTYGQHTYEISYHTTNLVKKCRDANYLDQVFIGGLDSSLGSARITVEGNNLTFTGEDTSVWAGGGAEGDIEVQDGKIVANTTASLSSNESFAILAEFATNMFSPSVNNDVPFSQIKDSELSGTDYTDDNSQSNSVTNFLSSLVPYIFYVFVVFAPLWLFRRNSSESSGPKIKHDSFLEQYKKPDYCRELPFDNNLAATYFRLSSLKKLESRYTILGVYILKWVQEKQIKLVKRDVKNFFKTKAEDAFFLNPPSDKKEHFEKALYAMFYEASDKSHVLLTSDFQNWCEKNYGRLDAWFKDYENYGFEQLKNMGVVALKESEFLGFIKTSKNVITDVGIELTAKMFGFKKYLEDFTIINEREVREVELWDEYLIYAQMFGIAEKVAKQFKDLYPKYFEQKIDCAYSVSDAFILFTLANAMSRSYVHSMYRGYNSGYRRTQAWSGKGGRFGGGGFSGAIGGGHGGVR